MKLNRIFLATSSVALIGASSAFAADIVKGNSGNALVTGANWVGGVAPTAADYGVFSSASSSNGLGAQSYTVASGNPTWGGIKVTDPSGPVTISVTTGTWTLAGNSSAGTAIDLSGASQDLTISGSGGIRLSNAAGAYTFNVASGRTLTINTGISPQSGSRTLTLNGGGNIVLNSNISSGGGNLGLSVNNSGGTVTLAGANTYNSGTTLTAGTLFVNNTTGSGTGTGALTGNGGIVAGTGTIGSGANGVTFNAGSKLSAGQAAGSVGTLSFNVSTANFSGASNDSGAYIFDLAAVGASDLININATGVVNIGDLTSSDFAFNLLSGFGEGTYTLFDSNVAITGTVDSSTFTLGSYLANLTLDSVNNSVLLNVAIPEPSVALLSGVAALGLLRRRRVA